MQIRFLLPVIFSVAISGVKAQDIPKDAPAGFGQLKNAPRVIPGGKDEEGRTFFYHGQASEKEKIILTPSNGFFTSKTCRAGGESDLPKVGDDELIAPNFAFLEKWTQTEGTLRWHFHIAKPGALRFQTYLSVPGNAAGSKIEILFAGQSKEVSTNPSDGKKPQSWDVVFDVKEAGEYQLSLQAKQIRDSRSGVGKLTKIEAFGPAMADANLLRVRWRPAAVHGGYESAKVTNPKLLVMTTRSMTPVSNYSPITTPFGYFGTVFTKERRSNGEFNFSMWGKNNAMTDLKQMPHLLGIGSPEGEFSGFGHEGSGVKARGWSPMPDQPELCVQALRVERGDLYDSYYGYYFDHPTKAWKFYCSGNKWHGGKSKETLKIGSFCEVPGPPQVERSGDIYREVRRRGWYYDGKDKWVPMEKFNASGKRDVPVNKSWYTTKEGEFAMGCGGIRLYEFTPPKELITKQQGLPYFLKSESLATIFTMPIEYGEISVGNVTPNGATVEINIKNGDNLKDGAVYFGKTDALTFAPRELHGTEKNSSLSKSINDNSWQEMQKISPATTGLNQVELSNLEPETTYYFRVLMNNDVSRVWNDKTLSFTTPKTGTLSMKKTEAKPSLKNEPFRTWTYALGGKQRTIEGRLTGIAGDTIQIERKNDGKKGSLKLNLFSKTDQAYVESKR